MNITHYEARAASRRELESGGAACPRSSPASTQRAVGKSPPSELRRSSSEPKTAWREERRRAFREAILKTAEELIRKTGGTGFSMQVLADKACVALVTPYSLFGSKAGVLYGLLNECVRRIDDQVGKLQLSDPIEQLLAVSKISADLYGSDPALYRPLLRFLSGALEPEHHPEILARAMRLYRSTIQEGIRRGLLLRSMRIEVLERHLLVNFTGVLQFWIQEELDGVGLRKHILYGTVLTLIPQVVSTARPRLFRRLAEFEKTLPKRLTRPVRPPKRGIGRIQRGTDS